MKVISRLARRWAGGWATKLPRPGSRRIRPSSARRCIALTGRHPAHAELGAQLGVGRQAFAGPEGRDPLAQGPLDLAVVRFVAPSVIVSRRRPGRSRRRRSAPSPLRGSPPRSPRPTCPSSAVTISISSSDVVWTRRRSSSRIGLEQQVAGRGDPAADDDPVRRDDGDHVGDADPEIAPDLGEAVDRPDVAGAGPLDRLLGGGGAAGRGDLVGPREGLEAAAVPAAAPRAVRVDRLVAELAGRPVVPEQDPAVDGDHPADAGPERQPDQRGRAAAGAQAQLGEAERAGVVDERAPAARGPRRPGRRRAVRPTARGSSPGSGSCRPPGRTSPGTPIPTDETPGQRPIASTSNGGEPRHHGIGAVGPGRRDLVPVEHAPVVGVALDDRPLDVRPAEVETEVAARWGAVHRSVRSRW